MKWPFHLGDTERSEVRAFVRILPDMLLGSLAVGLIFVSFVSANLVTYAYGPRRADAEFSATCALAAGLILLYQAVARWPRFRVVDTVALIIAIVLFIQAAVWYGQLPGSR